MSYTILTVDLTGQVFERLTVVQEGPRRGSKRRWICRCSCGVEKTVDQSNLRGGKVLSCGCLNEELKKSRAKHRMIYSHEYRAWANMWARCTNPKAINYDAYKSRRPPEIWRDFNVFLEEIGLRPSDDHTLDRIENDKPYGPGNVRWATLTAQARNRTSNVLVKLGGVVLPLVEACGRVGLNPRTVAQRMRRGASIEDASASLLQPIDGHQIGAA